MAHRRIEDPEACRERRPTAALGDAVNDPTINELVIQPSSRDSIRIARVIRRNPGPDTAIILNHSDQSRLEEKQYVSQHV